MYSLQLCDATQRRSKIKEVTILFFHVASQLLLKSNISCRAINLQKLFCLYCNYISREQQKAKRVCKNCINLLRSSDSEKSLLSSLGSFSCCGILKMSLNCRCVSFLPLGTSSSWIMSDNCRMCIWHAHKPKEWANKKNEFFILSARRWSDKTMRSKPQPCRVYMSISTMRANADRRKMTRKKCWNTTTVHGSFMSFSPERQHAADY